MRLPPTEQFILSLLSTGGASYGLQLVEASGGRLKRGGIYVTLGKMEEKGLVSSSLQNDGRRIYELQGLGHRALAAIEIMGDVSGARS
jgi:DNA-binding PadR family transcriptional regulator